MSTEADSRIVIDRKFPVRVPVLVIRLADFKAKPAANHANAHPMND